MYGHGGPIVRMVFKPRVFPIPGIRFSQLLPFPSPTSRTFQQRLRRCSLTTNHLPHPTSLRPPLPYLPPTPFAFTIMSAIRDVFMGKPFDFEAAMAEWKNPGPPAFKGVGKKDPVVDAWLDDIKAGCTERKIPKDFWHQVGQRSLGTKAKARFNEVEQVMMKMHDGKYKWNWKRFKVAMKNMGCEWDLSFLLFFTTCPCLSFRLTGL